MKYNCITLSFTDNDPSLEKEFLRCYFENSLQITRITVLLGGLFYALFGILDAIMLPEVKYVTWTIRYVIVCPIIFLVFALSYSKKYHKYWQFSLAAIIAAAGVGIICMIAVAPRPANSLYYAGLILVIMYGYTVFRTRFIWASLTEIKTLSGLLPICAKCKKIRDDKGYWKQIEEYISTHSDAEFSHSICPQCAKELYGDLLAQK